MFDPTVFESHELERIYNAPGTPDDTKECILQELHNREAAQTPSQESPAAPPVPPTTATRGRVSAD